MQDSTATSQARHLSVKDALTRRRSVRSFSNEPIPSEYIEDLLEAAISAPSGSNWQNQRFLVLTEPEEIQQVGNTRFVWPYPTSQDKARELHPSGILGNSAALIVVFADASQNDARGNGEYYIWESLETQNCSASIQNILTMATALGVASCWISASEKMNYTRTLGKKSWRECFSGYDIPSCYKIQGIVMLGMPRKLDHAGYPTGERKHGATVWQNTQRRPTSDYLVKRLNGKHVFQLSGLSRTIVLGCSIIIRVLLKTVRSLDKVIHRTEYKPLANSSRKQS